VLKIITILGTRPEIIRLSRIIGILDKHSNHQIMHTGQNFDFELNKIFFDELNIRKPNFFLEAAGKTAAETIGQIIIKVDKILATEKPDAVIVLGDTNSSLSTIAAKRRKIPIFHIEAGNRCFDQRVPEEINRKIVDHISDINLTYSSLARENLLRENFPPDQVIKIGSPMLEVLNYFMPQIRKSKIINKLNLTAEKYFLVSTHREENIEDNISFKKIKIILNTIAEKYKLPVIVSTHPHTQKKINETRAKFHKHVNLIKPLGFFDYVNLEMHARCVLSDSGSITEESSILNFPALNIRETHERSEGMEEAAVMMTGLDINRIQKGLEILQSQPRAKKRILKIVNDYNVPNVSQKVLRIIYSYTDYINRVVWKKYKK
jgi:UDP-N-acetylglucosamine 2-epimerase (non-hydrolysing)